jgi:tetratricopeptide (TPR) repeat protein
MIKRPSAFLLVLLALLCIPGCVRPHDVSELTGNVHDLEKLLQQQQQMLREKKTAAEVYGQVLKAEPHLGALRAVCEPEKVKPNFPERLYDFFINTDRQPHRLAADCLFFTGLAKKFNAEIMFNSGRYYAVLGEREKAEQILRALLLETDESCTAETTQARILLEDFKEWDAFTPGWKAYLFKDYAAAFKEYQASSDPRAQYKLGIMYERGEGVPEDKGEAFKSYKKAAEKGVLPAEYRVGILYSTGEGVDQDLTEAEKWLKKAADRDYAPAREAWLELRKRPRF